MELKDIMQKLTSQGWTEEDIANLPDNKLHAGITAMLSYKNRLFFRFHPDNGFIRLTILGDGDERCLQLEYGDILDKVIDAVISMQDTLSLDTYLMDYSTLQEVCPVSILTIEQFE